ncbi:hypothetical protein [Micromonospora zhanjiangensis]|uniref:Integrin beta 3 n=1 Tax=Micromonospora zhanjiangensis TaxID=1522057 RepID=A0ABV8KIY3_9ACTN
MRPEGPEVGTDDAGSPGSRAGSETSRQSREQRRLRAAALILACLVVLAALPLFFGIRAATRDPVFTSLDELDVPAWAALGKRDDDVSGSRWCLIECRLRERTVQSEKAPDETARAYQQALVTAGWQRWKPALCPEQPVEGHYTCWKRDELTLDLWVRKPACVNPAPPDGAPADPKKSTAPNGADDCSGAQVSVKVRNAIDDDRTKPQPSTDPSLTGVDPDPTLPDDPLRGPTPAPS